MVQFSILRLFDHYISCMEPTFKCPIQLREDFWENYLTYSSSPFHCDVNVTHTSPHLHTAYLAHLQDEDYMYEDQVKNSAHFISPSFSTYVLIVFSVAYIYDINRKMFTHLDFLNSGLVKVSLNKV